MSDSSAQASASVVGNQFVFQYYTVLHKNPQDLHHFYKERSTYTHGYEDGTDETLIGHENIGKKIQSLGFLDCKVTLSAVDCHASLSGGILITVIGFMSNNGEESKKFVETFFLAVQTDPAGYYVLNDSFRYLKDVKPEATEDAEEAVSQERAEPVVEGHHQETISQAQQQQEQKHSEELESNKATEVTISTHIEPEIHHAESTAAAATSNVSAPAVGAETQHISPPKQASNKPSPPNNKKQSSNGPEDPKQTQTATKQASSTNVSNAVSPSNTTKPSSKPNSWASIVKMSDNNVGSTIPSTNEESANGINGANPPVQPAVANKQDIVANKSIKKPKEPSLYVKNLPFEATEQEIRTTFARFGEIKHLDLRNGFCFVEYVNPQVVAQAIGVAKANPLSMGGRLLVLEEKKKSSGKKDKEKDLNKKNRPNRDTKEKKSPSQQTKQTTPQQTKREKTGEKNPKPLTN